MMSRFGHSWARACFHGRLPRGVQVVQDHERCLWQEKSLECLEALGLPVLENFPKCSPDLNAIEGMWHLLRQRLDSQAPAERETRPEFLIRLRRTVAWLNENLHKKMLGMCRDQRARARDVLLLSGARTKW